MSMINYGDPTITVWEVDNNGDKVSVPILNEKKQVTGNKIVLEGLPDEQYRVFIDGFVEVNIKDKITLPSQFKVDYRKNGIVFVHEGLDGQWLTISKYSSRGMYYLPASRVWTRVDDFGNVIETLAGVVEKIQPAIDLADNIQQTIARGEQVDADLNSSISTAGTTKTELDQSVSNATVINETLSNPMTGTIKQAINKNIELQSAIVVANTTKTDLEQAITNAELDTIRGSISNLAGTGRTTETVKDNSDKIGILSGVGEVKEKANKSDFDSHLVDGKKHWNILPVIPVGKSIGNYLKESIDTGVEKGIFFVHANTPSNPSNSQGYIEFYTDRNNTGYVAVTLRTFDNREYKALFLSQDATMPVPWERVVTNKAIPWISATLQNGWQGAILYRKNQLNQLEIVSSLYGGLKAWGTILTILPLGYRPEVYTPILAYNVTSGSQSSIFVLDIDGTIVIREELQEGTHCSNNVFVLP